VEHSVVPVARLEGPEELPEGLAEQRADRGERPGDPEELGRLPEVRAEPLEVQEERLELTAAQQVAQPRVARPPEEQRRAAAPRPEATRQPAVGAQLLCCWPRGAVNRRRNPSAP
jgi:hypothetical protein